MLLLTVGQLADELGLPVEAVIGACRAHGISVFSDRSPLTGGEAQRVRAELLVPVEGDTAGPARRRPRPAPTPRPARDHEPGRARRILGGVLTLLAVAGIAAGTWYVLTDDGGDDAGPDDVAVATVPPTTTTTIRPTTTTAAAAPTTAAPAVVEPAPGQCWDGADAPVLVPCEGPHEAEAYAAFVHPAGPAAPYPGDEAVAAFAADQCAFRFESFVGRFLTDSALALRLRHPDADAWTDGDRAVTCSVQSGDGSPLVGTAARSAR